MPRDSIYLFRNNDEQINAPVPGEINDIQNVVINNNLAELDINRSSYHTAYDRHMDLRETATKQINEELISQYQAYLIQTEEPMMVREIMEINKFWNSGSKFTRARNEKKKTLQNSYSKILSKGKEEQRKIFDEENGRGEYDRHLIIWNSLSGRFGNYSLLNKDKVAALENKETSAVTDDIHDIIDNLNENDD